MAKKNYYAVKKGRKIGIYKTWEECKKQIDGFSGAEFKGFSTLNEAKDYIGNALKEDSSSKKQLKQKYYCVRKGLTPNIYMSWEECQTQVKGFPNAEFESFTNLEDALSYMGITFNQSNINNNSKNKKNVKKNILKKNDSLKKEYIIEDNQCVICHTPISSETNVCSICKATFAEEKSLEEIGKILWQNKGE